jgi:mRNA interferase YafQ
MRQIERSGLFRRDYKRELRRDPQLGQVLAPLLGLLAGDEPLPIANRDHPLKGEWRGYRDCHVKPDLVLIYAKRGADLLRLARLGSHSELFK